jgi:prenyltransferase beta subunit
MLLEDLSSIIYITVVFFLFFKDSFKVNYSSNCIITRRCISDVMNDVSIDIGNRNRHIKYFKHCLNLLPARLAYLDSQRLVLAHFALGGLSILGGIDELKNKDEFIEWIYSLQSENGGFYGSEMMSNLPHDVATPHIASTFSALQSLLMLGDNLDRIKINLRVKTLL